MQHTLCCIFIFNPHIWLSWHLMCCCLIHLIVTVYRMFWLFHLPGYHFHLVKCHLSFHPNFQTHHHYHSYHHPHSQCQSHWHIWHILHYTVIDQWSGFRPNALTRPRKAPARSIHSSTEEQHCGFSHTVTHPSTNAAYCCLTSILVT